jgi:hypothetical protein
MVFLSCRDVDGFKSELSVGFASVRQPSLLSTLRSNCMVLDGLNGQYGLRPETVKYLLDS